MFCQLAARVSFMSADESGQRAMTAFWVIVPCQELRFVDRMLRPAFALSQRILARRRNEVWIKPFQRFAGSQGRALSRVPQDAKSPFDFPVPRKGKSTKLSFQAPPAGGESSVLRSWLGRTSRPQPYGKIPHRDIF